MQFLSDNHGVDCILSARRRTPLEYSVYVNVDVDVDVRALRRIDGATRAIPECWAP